MRFWRHKGERVDGHTDAFHSEELGEDCLEEGEEHRVADPVVLLAFVLGGGLVEDSQCP